MKCPKCGFDRILPMYKFCPKCNQPLHSVTENTEAKVSSQNAPETKLLTGLLWTYKRAIGNVEEFKNYAEKNPNDSHRLLEKWKNEGRDISTLVANNVASSLSDPKSPNPNNGSAGVQSSPKLEDGSKSSSIKTNMETASLEKPVAKDVDIVSTSNKSRNYITWTVAKGQFARNITAREFSGIADVDGVYVDEGVTAIIFVDGQLVSELNGGLYTFVTDKLQEDAASQYAEDEEDKRAHEGIIQKMGRAGRSLLHLIFGKSDKKRREDDKKRRDTIKEIAKKISGDSIVSVVLKRDAAIAVTMGIRPVADEDGNAQMKFAPYKIHTKTLTLDVAVALEARISDFYEFRTHYLVDQNSYSVNDLRLALNTWMRTTLQRELADYEADGQLLPQERLSNISYNLMSQSKELLHGIVITNILDITTSNEAFERFRSLEEKFYCTEKEIEYLGRSNEFKNRLQQEENAQKLREATTELDLRKELDKINNDKLIHEDEMEAFVQLLQSQKRIREARTENEELAELLKLKGNRLLSEDEYDAIESDIRNKKFSRDQVSAAFQLAAIHQTEKTRLQLETELEKNQILADAELEDARFEALRKSTLQDFSLDDIEQEHRRKQERAETAHQSELLDSEINATRRKDEYGDLRREKDFDFEQRQKDAEYARTHQQQRDNLDIEKERAQNEMEMMRQEAEIARKNLETMMAHDEAMAEKSHQEEMARISAQQDMTAEQLMAFGASGLSAEAQKAFAESFSAGKDQELAKDMYERMLKMQTESSSSNQAQQAALMQQMMQMMQNAMQTNATMASNMSANQSAQNQAQLDAMQNIAGARITQSEKMKDEYRTQMEHEQKRTDAAQDRALNYTTKVTQAEIQAGDNNKNTDSSAMSERMYFLPDFGNNYSRNEVENYILQGIISPESDIMMNNVNYKIFELSEFYTFLLAKFGVTCPKCGKKYLKGFMCECGYEE